MNWIAQKLKVTIGTAALLTILGGAGSVIATPTSSIVSGNTSVSLNAALINALNTLQVQPGAVGEATLRRGVASFPISGGAVDQGSVKLEITHQGGLSFTAGNTIVELTDFVITNLRGEPTLTGLVQVNDNLVARIPLFKLQLSSLPSVRGTSARRQLSIQQVRVILTKPAADALNRAFGVTTFREGLRIGTAQVNGRIR
jgi:hypothetical protein